MSFYRKYELDRLLADGDAKTFRAVENASGRIVFLHLFNSRGLHLLATLKSHLIGLNGEAKPPLVEIGEFAGSQYAVTEALHPFTNITEWIGSLSGDALPIEPEPVPVSVEIVASEPEVPVEIEREAEAPRAPEPAVKPQFSAEEPAEDFGGIATVVEPAAPATPKLRGATGTLEDLREFSRDFQPVLPLPSRPKPAPAPEQTAPPAHVPLPAFATEKRSNSGMAALISLVILIVAILAILLLKH